MDSDSSANRSLELHVNPQTNQSHFAFLAPLVLVTAEKPVCDPVTRTVSFLPRSAWVTV